MSWETLVSVFSGCIACARYYGPHAIAAYLFNAVRIGRAERSEAFDERFGTTTAEVTYPWHLPSLHSKKAAEVHPYEATPAWLVRSILRSLAIAPERFTFVDMGSGKGRVLLLASEFPFARITGIEIALELHDIAWDNIEHHTVTTPQDQRFDLRCMDAAQYEFVPEPLVLFLFNPFGRATLEAVMARLEQSLRETPREAFVVYVNPRFERRLRHSALFQRAGAGGSRLRPWSRYVIYRSLPAPERLTAPLAASQTADCPA